MNLKFQPLQIDPVNPFDSDLLGRKDEIENLTALLLNLNSPAVLAVDSRWGTGKTTFIRLWEQYLKSEGLSSLYFNAWETDFSEDPLVSFLGEMNVGLKTLIGVSKESQDSWSKTKVAGKQIAKRGIPALIKIGTAGVIDVDEIVEDELSKAMGALAGDALDDYLQQKNSISEFHSSLSDFVKKSTDGKPIVIFVDELDRCRPTYAIALLERIKHLFNIEYLVFVLALDKIQLGHSIGAVYGDGIDSSGYLRRFIDFEYQLKHPEIKGYINSLFTALSLDKFFAPREKYKELKYDRQHLENVFLMLAEANKFSLREIEQLLASINLALRTAKENEYIYPALLAFLVVTKNFQPDLYQQYILEHSTESEMIEYLYEIIPETTRQDSFECALVEGFLIAAKKDKSREIESESLNRHKMIVEDEELTHQEMKYSEIVVDVVKRPAGIGHDVNLKTLVERIDLLSQFDFPDDGYQ